MTNKSGWPATFIKMPVELQTTYAEAFPENVFWGTVGSGKTSGSGIPLKESKPDFTATEDTEHE